MALDTANARRSAWAWLVLTVAPVADGTIDDLDRQQAAFVYSGIDVTAGGAALRSLRTRRRGALIQSMKRRRPQ